MEAIADGKPRLLDFGVTNEQAWEVGLACGGKVAGLRRARRMKRATSSTRLAGRARRKRAGRARDQLCASGQQR